MHREGSRYPEYTMSSEEEGKISRQFHDSQSVHSEELENMDLIYYPKNSNFLSGIASNIIDHSN